MTYRQLIRTLELFAKYDGGLDKECTKMWATYEQHGISSDFATEWDPNDVRELLKLGNLLGCDDSFAEMEDEIREKIEDRDIDSLTDEEIMEAWEYSSKGVYKYE